MDSQLTHALSTLLDANGSDRATALLEHLATPRRLSRLTVSDLVATRLVSAAEASRIAGAFTLVAHVFKAPPHVALQHPSLVARTVPSLWSAPLEELWLVPVDGGLRPLVCERVAIGGPESCHVSATEILRRVLVACGSGCFLLHNHPSGNPTPSAIDVRFTRDLTRRAAALDLVVHDHIVVAGLRWASCARDAAGSLLDPVAVAPP